MQAGLLNGRIAHVFHEHISDSLGSLLTSDWASSPDPIKLFLDAEH